MSGSEYKTCLAIVLFSLSSLVAFPQEVNTRDSLNMNIPPQFQIKPILHYSLGTTFMAVPHRGSITGFTLTPELSIPVSPRFSVNGGFIAGRYYSYIGNINPEGVINSTYNALSIYASASYHYSPQLTLYGAVIRQVAGPSPVNFLPKTSYTLGSTYDFGHFSVGVSVHMSNWYNHPSPFPANGSNWLYPPFSVSQGPMVPLFK